MRKNNIRSAASISFYIFLLLFILVHDAYAAEKKNFLWKVGSGSAKVYVLGSIHFMKKDIYPLNSAIENAFNESGTLAVEANINDAGNMDIFSLMEGAFFMTGDTFEKHVSKGTFELVKKETALFGLPFEIVNMQKPWFLALSLSSLELMKLGYDPSNGIDMHFLSKAGGKKIVELEGLDYQINLFSGFSDEEQELFLLQTLQEIKQLNKEVDDLVHAWKNGDAKGLEAIMSKSVEGNAKMAGVYEKLLFERNRNMVSKMQGFLNAGGTYFVVVGAGHLVGKKGIIQILKDKGYRVEQM